MRKDIFSIIFLFICVTSVFFYPLFRGYIPFSGDNLVANFGPYNAYSYAGYTPGSVPNKAQGHDVIREAYPWKFFTIESFKRGEIPFWTPYNFSGNLLMANFQSAVFYPLNSIFFFLPFSSAWSVFIFLSPVLAAFFTYFFLRELKLSVLAGIFGGIVFAFSSYMVVWLEYGNVTHTFLWLPLALLFTHRLTKKFSLKSVLFLIFTLLFSILGGYIQGYFYLVITVIVYFLAQTSDKKNYLKQKFAFFIALCFPILFSLFQLLPTIELFTYSSRNNYSLVQIQQMLNPWWYAITVIIPDFFGNPGVRSYWYNGTYIEQTSYFGVIAFILAFAAVLSFKQKKEIKIFSFLFVITFLIAFDLFFTKYIYTLPIPTLSTTIPTRILGLFQFCGAILAAFGLEFFLQKKQKKSFIIASVCVLLIIFSVFIFTVLSPKLLSNTELIPYFAITKRNTILPLFFVSVFTLFVFIQFFRQRFLKNFSKKFPVFIAIVIVLLTVGDLFYFFHKITPFSPKEFVYPQTAVMDYVQKNAGIDRFWGYGSAYIDSNFQTYDKTFSPEGYDPLHSRLYSELLDASVNGEIPQVPKRSDANIAPGYGNQDLNKNMYRQQVLNLLGVKYILHKDNSLKKQYLPDKATFNPKRYTLLWQKTPWQVYENREALPRVFLASNYIVEKNKRNSIKKLLHNSVNIKDTVILEEEITSDIKIAKDTNAKVTIKEYTPNKVIVKTVSKTDGILFLSDNYYPGWEVFIDGRKDKIYKANYAFRSVPVKKGEHEIIFVFKPQSFTIGLTLSVISLIGLFVLVAIIKKRRAYL